MLAQLGAITLATLAISSEYSTGSIVMSLQAVPNRARVLAAKAGVVAVLGALLGLVTSAVATAGAELTWEVRRVHLERRPLTALGVAAYFAFLGVLALGLGTLLRSTAGTITTLLLMLLVVPQILGVLQADWVQRLVDYLPMTAAGVVISRDAEPYPVIAAVLVLVVWATATLEAGLVALKRRDV